MEQVIGEQYMPMISDWYKADTTKMVSSFGRFDGGCCDNDVHEIFKCLGEILLTSAYVYEDEDGKFVFHNCKGEIKNNMLTVTTAEDCINKVHFNLRSERIVTVSFGETEIKNNIICGWIEK